MLLGIGIGVFVIAFIYFWNAPIEDEYDNPFWRATQWVKRKVGK